MDPGIPKDLYGGVSDEAMMEAVPHKFIYLRRGIRASDDGTDAVVNGHYKVGVTGKDDVNQRKTDGSLPAQSYAIAQWRVPGDCAQELEKEVHAMLAHLNIALDRGGREWFTWRKVLKDGELWEDLDTQERWLLAMIDGCLLTRHERVPAPCKQSRPSQTPSDASKRALDQGAESAPARARTDTHDTEKATLTRLMLDTWRPPTNAPPVEMRQALRDAVKGCTDPPTQHRASDGTAKSSRIALNIAAVFKRYTEWDGRDIWAIRENKALKKFLDASKPEECRIFGAGSDCGAGSGSQSIRWSSHVAKLSAATEGERVAVRLVVGGKEYVWRAEW